VWRRALFRLVGLGLIFVSAVAGPRAQAPADIAVVVGDREYWSSGARVTILIRAPIASERDAVVREICQMTEAQFRQHWIAKVFRADTPSGPKIVYSNEMAIDKVSRTPGAVTFVQAPVNNPNVKILRVDGRLPGQNGYRLR
jgi:hypothetical protein